MRSATTAGLALVIAAFLFLCPMGVCAQTTSDSAEHSHPCCPGKPAPVQNDLPGCSLLFVDTGVVPSVSNDADFVGAVWQGFKCAVVWDRTTAEVPVAGAMRFASRPRFVTLHQFLI
jgi:hypothetical protein